MSMFSVARDAVEVGGGDRASDVMKRLSEELARVFSTMEHGTKVIITVQGRMPDGKEVA